MQVKITLKLLKKKKNNSVPAKTKTSKKEDTKTLQFEQKIKSILHKDKISIKTAQTHQKMTTIGNYFSINPNILSQFKQTCQENIKSVTYR